MTTQSRLPKSEALTETELINFSLLEGEWLHSMQERYKAYTFVVDLIGNIYLIKISEISLARGQFWGSYGFTELRDYDSLEAWDVIRDSIMEYEVELWTYEDYAAIYGGVGC